MKKSDYLFLAQSLRKRISAARQAVHLATDPDAARASVTQWETAARELAMGLHVERSAFLSSCGVKP